MIDFETHTYPFTTLDHCGDFAVRIKRDDGDLIAVGDVAGHGEPEVGQLAQRCIREITKSGQLSLRAILDALELLPGMNNRGVSIFLGLFDHTLPLLHYYLLGDISVHHQHNGKLTRLPNHQPPLGIAPNGSQRFRSIKVLSGDLFALNSDGIKLGLDEITNTTGSQDISGLYRRVLSRSSQTQDDAVVAIARVRGGHAESLSSMTLHNTADTPLLHSYKSQHNPTELTPAEPKPPIRSGEQTKLLSEEYKIGELNARAEVRPYLRLLWELIDLSSFEKARLESFLLQALESTNQSIQLYADAKLLQIQLLSYADTTELAIALFSEERVQAEDNKLWVSIRCSFARDLTTEDRTRLQLHLSSANFKEMTQRKKNDSLLAQQSKLAAMGEMVGAIAHQWRQPLNELALRIQRLQLHQHQVPITTDEIDTFTAESLELIQHMANTIDDFREFFSQDTETSSFDLRPAIEEVMRLHSAQLRNNNIQIQLSGDSFEVEGQPSHLKQILFNLISNSRDAFREREINEPKISIKLNLQQRSLLFEDNAGGVDEDKLERIFEPYYTTKEHGQGTGMGLYMCRMLAMEHLNATISAHNLTHPQRGLGIRLELAARTRAQESE